LSNALKQHAVLLVSVLLLCSCTSVENFGAYWDKGFIDPALEGSWKKIGIPGEKLSDTPGAYQLLFTTDGTSHAMQAINPVTDDLPPDVAAQRRKDNEGRYLLLSADAPIAFATGFLFSPAGLPVVHGPQAAHHPAGAGGEKRPETSKVSWAVQTTM